MTIENQQPEAINPYSVEQWCSHPDEGNDDCNTGEDFPTLAQAELALSKGTADYDVAFLVLNGPDKLRIVVSNPNYNAAKVLRERRRHDAEWKRECAMQAGMAFGVDGYNDEMGWSTESEDSAE